MLCKEIKNKKVNIAETVDFTNISRELIFIFFKKIVPVLLFTNLIFTAIIASDTWKNILPAFIKWRGFLTIFKKFK